jgi:hypothetical protein
MRHSLLLAALAVSVLALGPAGCGSPAHPGGATPAPAGVAPPTTAPPATAMPGTAPPATVTPSAAGRPDHIVVVVFENKSYEQLVAAQAPWLHALMSQAAVFTDAHAVTHPSQPNYLALFSGSTQGVTDDHCPVRLGARPNLARSLLDAGLSFTGFSEGLPAAGSRACTSGRYAAKHNPWADFDNVPAAASQPFTSFPSTFADLPTVSFVVPDLCHDMHDCPIGTGDDWAAQHLDGYRRWAPDHRGLLVVTFDEDDNSSGNQIPTMVSGAGVRPGRYPQRVDHYSLLRAIEDCYGLPAIGASASAAALPGFC